MRRIMCKHAPYKRGHLRKSIAMDGGLSERWFSSLFAKQGISFVVGLAVILFVFSGCKTTKFVPDGEYLLNKAKVKITDTKDVAPAELRDYLRQKQNSEVLGFWKLQLGIYNTAPADTTKKGNAWLARNAHKIGEAPEIYDEELTRISMEQVQRTMQNKGYFNAQVDTIKKIKDKKINLTYLVTANQPYTIRNYKVRIDQPVIHAIATNREQLIKVGMQFSSAIMDEERQRITTRMHNDGYFYFDKSMLEYTADSSYNCHGVDIELVMPEWVNQLPDSIRQRIYTKYSIHRIYYHIDYDPSRLPKGTELHVETDKYGNEYSYVGKRFLRPSVLRKNCRLKVGEKYSERQVERTYAMLNSLAPIKYVDISFETVGEDLLDCHITVSRGKLNNISAEVEGTYSAGDWGIAAGVGYINKNIFRGAEQLSLSGRASYEWRQNGGRAIEGKAEAGLMFPNSLRISIAYNYQQRPDEYTRTIANAGLYYTIPHRPQSRWTHRFNFLDISYIYLPWMSDRFRKDFIDKSSVLKSSYEDHFILDWSYSGSYTNYRSNSPTRSYINFNYTIETAGNALYGLAKAVKMSTNDAGSYTLFHIPFAQYAKADVNFTFHHIMAPAHQLVYHAGIGIAVPYLNANILPFEKRYFSGGSNSVRGWQARTLGPGGFRGADNTMVYDLQAGDIRLDLNIEYRWKVWTYIELAAFVDAGNIWTIRDYEQQPHGVFRWNEFYRQIALSYGVGLRLDFSLLIFRLDLGVKLYDPSRLYDALSGTQWRTVPNGLSWKNDMTLHFAIGYPF